MNTTLKLAIAAGLALAAAGAVSGELNEFERAEMRERANAMQAQRVQNPGVPTGDIPLDRPRGDLKLDQRKGEVKARPKDSKSATKKRSTSSGKKKRGRSLSDMPGALVRK